MSSVYFLVGKVLGKYKILEHIGHGGMSEVYRGQQLQLHRPVAIKVLHPFLADDEGFVVRFQREARIIATLRHPNIVQVFDFDHNPELDLYYMVMEYIDGPTLKSRMERESLPLAFVAGVCADIADALDYAHARGMIHRDVKPANIMFLDSEQPVLTDFGIARMLTLSGLTASGAMVGTPAYMAPEVGTGKPSTAASDIYALGVVLFHAVTGSLPFTSESPMGIVMQHINEPPPRPSTLAPTIPPALEAVILKAMAKDPAERFSRAGKMASALRQAMGIEKGNGAGVSLPVTRTPPAPKAAPIKEDISDRSMEKSGLTPVPADTGTQRSLAAAVGALPASRIERTPIPAGGDMQTAHTRAPFSKLRWAWLFTLALGITMGALWLGTSGYLPSFNRPSPTAVPLPSIAVPPTPVPPASTPVPTAIPSPTAASGDIALWHAPAVATPQPATCIPRGRIEEVRIHPGNVVGPGSNVTALIAVRNNGTCAWLEGTQLSYISGERMAALEEMRLDVLASGSTLQLHLPMTAPQAYGAYTSVWQLQQPDGSVLGRDIVLTVEVQDLPTATPEAQPAVTATPVPLSLNLPQPELVAWHPITGTSTWQGTLLLQAEGGSGTASYYHEFLREETLLEGALLTLTALRCQPLVADIWVLSGVDLLHVEKRIPYPAPEHCK